MTVRLLPFAASSAWGIDLLVPIFATLGHVYIKTDGGVHNNPIISPAMSELSKTRWRGSEPARPSIDHPDVHITKEYEVCHSLGTIHCFV